MLKNDVGIKKKNCLKLTINTESKKDVEIDTFLGDLLTIIMKMYRRKIEKGQRYFQSNHQNNQLSLLCF